MIRCARCDLRLGVARFVAIATGREPTCALRTLWGQTTVRDKHDWVRSD